MQFYDEVPGVEIRKRVTIFSVDGKECAAMPLDTARAFNRALGAAIAMHDHPPANIFPIAGVAD